MKWHLNIDKGQYEILDDLEFQNLITSNDAQSAANLALELVEEHQRSRFEKILYRLLGLKIEDNVPKGRLEISLNKEKALIIFLEDDGDNGSVGTVFDQPDNSRDFEDFITPNGERFQEPTINCVDRNIAIDTLSEFFRTKRRPKNLKWNRINNP